MKVVLRRCQSDRDRQPARELRVRDLVIDLQSHAVTKAGQSIQLTKLEFRIFSLLAMNEGRVIPYARLVEYAWGYDEGHSSLLKTHICHIRSKLKLPLDGAGSIRSMSGVGYTLARS
jgi:DNA-binding response OmpR family regulator